MKDTDFTHLPETTDSLPLQDGANGWFNLMNKTSAGYVVWRVLPPEGPADLQVRSVLERAERRLVATRNAAVSADMSMATDWSDMRRRLAVKGFSLHLEEGAIWLCDLRSGGQIGTLEELGLPLTVTLRRLGPYEAEPAARMFA